MVMPCTYQGFSGTYIQVYVLIREDLLDASDIGNLLYETEKVPINGTLPLDDAKTKILFALMFLLGESIC